MGKAKLQPAKVAQMLRSGMSKAEVARHYGVHRSAVTQCCDKNKINVNTHLIKSKKEAQAIIRRDSQVLDDVQAVLGYGRSMVELTTEAAKGNKKALQRLDDLGVKDKLQGWSKVCNDFINNLEKYVGMQKTMFDVGHTLNFQQAIVDCIKEEYKDPRSKEVMRRLIKRLRENKQLKNLLS